MDIPRTPTKRGRVGIPSLRRRAATAYPPRQAILVLARVRWPCRRIDRQMSFGGDLPHRQSCRNIADDTCNDIALTIVLRADRT